MDSLTPEALAFTETLIAAARQSAALAATAAVQSLRAGNSSSFTGSCGGRLGGTSGGLRCAIIGPDGQLRDPIRLPPSQPPLR